MSIFYRRASKFWLMLISPWILTTKKFLDFNGSSFKFQIIKITVFFLYIKNYCRLNFLSPISYKVFLYWLNENSCEIQKKVYMQSESLTTAMYKRTQERFEGDMKDMKDRTQTLEERCSCNSAHFSKKILISLSRFFSKD